MSRFLFLLILFAMSLPAQRRNEPKGEAGKFDLYVLSLSWSPQHCSTPSGRRDQMQCGGTRQYGFIAHGLWPQYEKGWPQFCRSNEALPKPVIDEVTDIMPSPQLIRHEWSRHGVCDGRPAREYFFKVRAAHQKVKVPPALQKPANARTVKPEVIRNEFVAANPGMPAESIIVTCSGRFLQEVRVCFTKDLQARACTPEIQRQACRVPQLIVQPLR